MSRRPIPAALVVVLLSGPVAADPALWADEWPRTDCSLHNVDLTEIHSGGPPRDGIPAVDAPAFVPVREETVPQDREPVLTLDLGGEVRAYPIRYLMWHEIANDTVGDVPVAVTI